MSTATQILNVGGKHIPANQILKDAREYLRHHGDILYMTRFCKWAYGFIPDPADHQQIATILDEAEIPRKRSPRPKKSALQAVQVDSVHELYFSISVSQKGVFNHE